MDTASPNEPLPIAQRRFLNLASSAAYTDLSVITLRRLIEAGKLTALRPVKGRIVLDRLQLEQYIATATAAPRTGRGLHRAREAKERAA